MNFWERHIGDWLKDTTGLSMLEDGAYSRLCDVYYTREKALPTPIAECCKLARAITAVDRKAVKTVLENYFSLREDGWHHKKCDEVIAAYLAGEPEREQKREGDKERQRRHRERRAKLFADLRELGEVPSWSTTNHDLEALLSRVTSRQSHGVTVTDMSRPVTRDKTATSPQSPLPSPQSPEKDTHTPIPDPQSRAPHSGQKNGTAAETKTKGSVCEISELPAEKARAQH